MKIFYGNTELLDIVVNDESYRYRTVRGEHNLTLYFSLAEHVEIPVGAYCEYQDERFTLYSPANLKMQHSRSFEYTVVFESAQAETRMLKFRNPVDGRLKFSLTATPFEFLEMLISNMERNSSEWRAGDCIKANPKTISFNHTSCADALSQIADEFDTEYEFNGRTVSLHKVEHNRDNPLELSYGKGNGFKSGIGRTNYSRQSPIGVLYVQGGSKNIVPGQNGGSSELLLPKSQTIRFDGVHFEDETGFDSSKARTYITDAEGMTIRRTEPVQNNVTEDSLDCTEIYPSRIGRISEIRFLNSKTGKYYTEAQNWSDEEWKDILIDIIDKDIPESLDYNESIMDGEKITVIFQDGMLAGKEFDAEYFHESKDGKPARRFEIVQQEIDGTTMPGGNFRPLEGQKFVVLGCSVPETYICDNGTKSGASWEMFRKGVRYLYENEEQKFTFTGQLDGIWAKKDWLNIGGKIRLGEFVRFTDSRFQQEPVLIRITGIKDYVNNPHSPEIQLSNETVGSSLSGTLQKIESNEVTMEERHKEARLFTKRRFRDSQESIAMLKEAIMSGFSDSISPLTVQTMMALIGDKSLQFRFVDGMNNPNPVSHDIHYDNDRKVLVCEEGIIQHMTFEVKGISPAHGDSEYRFWQLPAFESPVMDEPDKSYYLYAKVRRNDSSGDFYLSKYALPMEPAEAIENVPDWKDCYFLLVGLLGSEQNGERSYSSWYGFTEISPGQVMTDVIRDADGRLVIDLSQATIIAKDGAKIEGSLSIGSGSSGLDNIKEWTDETKFIMAEKKSLREELLKIMNIKEEPECSIDTRAIRESDGKLDISKSNSSWKEVKSGDVNNGNSQNLYIGWIKSSTISHNGTTLNTLTITNSNETDRFLDMEFQSDGESSFDYLMVGRLDQDTTPSASDSKSYELSTKGKQKTVFAKSYTIPPGEHTLKLVYRKDTSVSSGTDSAYYRIVGISKEIELIDVNFGNLNSGSLYDALEKLDGKSYARLGEKAQELLSGAQELARCAIDYFDVWADGSTSVTTDNRSLLTNTLKEYYKREHAISDDIVDSNFGYLAKTFGDSMDVEGVVLSRMVGVKDRIGNVVSGLNGSDMGKDDTHGKMLFFGGTNRATDEDIRNADTKIYEDGTIVTKKLIATHGSQLGLFRVRDDGVWLDATNEIISGHESVSHSLSPAVEEISYQNIYNGTDDLLSLFRVQAYGSAITGPGNSVVNIYQNLTDTDNRTKNQGLNINIQGTNAEAIHIENGVIAGFAAKKKVFDSGAYEMTPEYLYYHSWGIASHLYLPIKAQIGTIFFVDKPYFNTSVTIYAPTGEVIRSIPQSNVAQSLIWSSPLLFIIVQKVSNTEWYGLQLEVKQK